ncbi:MAG: alpha/beta hydrolase [Anaerolineaceae bacterium]|nr:alpha/beta hydrolase [Anaerolineaceae bacterium]
MTETIHQVQIYYERIGTGEKKVLLLHGWGCDSSFMLTVADRLKDEYQILIPDFPGHGKSGEPPEPWGVPDYADCLLELVDQLQFTHCAVIAHSFGARVAAWIASEHHDVFDRIILTGAAGIRPPQTEQSKKRSARYQTWKMVFTALDRVPLLKPAAAKLRQSIQKRYGSRDYNALNDEMKKTFVKVIQQDLSDCYPRIAQPTLLLWGDLDQETPVWMGRRMEKEIPDAALVLLEGGSHFAYLEQLDRFILITKNFLAS